MTSILFTSFLALLWSSNAAFAQLDNRNITAETLGQTLCAQADDGEIGIAWHFSGGFEETLFLCQVFHQKPDGHIISLQQAMDLMQAGNGDQIIFDSDFVINQECSFVLMLSVEPSATDDGTFTQFDVSSVFKDVIGSCPNDMVDVSGTMEIIMNGLSAEFDVEFSGSPTAAGDEVVLNIPFGSVVFPPIANHLDDRSISMETHGNTECFQADDAEEGIAWHFTDGFHQVLYLCQVFHQKSAGGAIISLQEAVELMTTGKEDDIIFDSDFTVTQDCSFVAMIGAALSPDDDGSKTLFDVTSVFKDVIGNCPRSDFTVTGTMEIVDQTTTGGEEGGEVGLTSHIDVTFAGVAVALSPLLPRNITAETQGRTLCEQADDAEQGIAWHYSDGFEQVLYLCQVFHEKPNGNIITLTEVVGLMQQGDESLIIFDSDFVVEQGCSFVAMLTAALSDDDDGSKTLFDVTSIFKDVVGNCPNNEMTVSGTMEITNNGLGLSSQFEVEFDGPPFLSVDEPNVPTDEPFGDQLQNRTIFLQTHGNTVCTQADDDEEGIVWHFTDGFQQLLFLCQVFHQKSQGNAVIPIEDAIKLMIDGQEDDIIFDSDFLVTQDCSFVAILSATLSPMDDGAHTLFDVTSNFKDVIGTCPHDDFEASGTMQIVDVPLFSMAGAGLTAEFEAVFSGDSVNDAGGGDDDGGDDNGGTSSTNKALLALTIVFAILTVIACGALCFMCLNQKNGRYGNEPRGSEMRRADYNKMED